MTIIAHVMDNKTGAMIARPHLGGCPRVGDELRLADDRYYLVKRIIWCLDEDHRFGQRVNIGVELAK